MGIRAAIVEDEDKAFENLESLLKRYAEEKKIPISVFRFADAVKFLNDYRPNYDVVFMDIRLPYMNGLDAARKMREYDPDVFLIFVTDLAQYAIKGYEVNAFDYIVKPVIYDHLVSKLDKVVRLSEERDREPKISIKAEDGYVVLSASSISYIEVINHVLVYHAGSRSYSVYGSLKQVENILPANSFSRCNNCYLVNLKFVTAMNKDFVSVGEDKLKISRLKKKEFIDDFTNYLGRHS